MVEMLHFVQPSVKAVVASGINDRSSRGCEQLRMVQRNAIHMGKTPPRLHFIREWAEKRGMSQADVSRKTGADKGLVSRWFNEGVVPGERYLSGLAEVFQLDEPAALFRHPDEDWISRFFAERTEDERKRMIQTLEAAFPRKRA